MGWCLSPNIKPGTSGKIKNNSMKSIKTIITLTLFSLFTSCMSTNTIRSKNRENIVKLSLGITKEEALTIMGTQTLTADDGTKINNPWRTEIMKGGDGNLYEILFYYTDVKDSDVAVTDNELTPIVISENKVIGWGWLFLNENVKKYQIEVN
jgi:hypothetical protein